MNNTVLIIQPPAGTASTLVKEGLIFPFNIAQSDGDYIDDLVKRIKQQQYRFVIHGLSWRGDIDKGLVFINKLLQNNIDFTKTIIIIYSYKGLIESLNKIIKDKNIILPDNWYIIAKETTYFYEHEALIEKIKELKNQ